MFEGRNMNDDEVREVIEALLKRLPVGYPVAKLSKDENGYMLTVAYTIIFRGALSEEAIRHTTHYVKAREKSPTLPVGVIYGLYD